MSSAMSFARMVRVLALAIPCLVPLLFGCESESYPPELKYPLRSDPIVTEAPGATIWDTIRPGQLDHHVASLPELGGKTLDPAKVGGNDRQQLDGALHDIFGTPAEPMVTLKNADDEIKDLIKAIRLDDKELLKKGSVVYRRHCMHCHGVTGDGRGPTGPWVNPTPRDYRAGLFKFMSTAVNVNHRKPRREDLHRTLEHGIEGTSMPSFGLLEDHEKEELVSYVIHLSLRGETEIEMMKALLGSGFSEGDLRSNIQEEVKIHLKDWADSDKQGLEPGNYPYRDGDSEQARTQVQESIRRGYKLFTDPRGDASCILCHVDFGRQAPFRYDKWGTLVRPANLTTGVFRGGRRPVDIYWRIRGGIEPSQMPRANFEIQGGSDSYWDLVNFVQALPYPRMLPKDLRDEIYGTRARYEKTTEHAQR